MPSDGKMIEQIDEAWGGVDTANTENKRWNLEQLKIQKLNAIKAESFKQKVDSHNSWTDGKVDQLQMDDYTGAPLGTIAALIKKLEAFESDRLARESRVHEIGTIAAELDDAAYGDAETVNNMYAEVYQTWNDITQVTEERAAKLAEALAKAEKLEAVWLDIATRAAPLMAFLNETKSSLTAPIIAESEEDVNVERAGLVEIQKNLEAFDVDYTEYAPLSLVCSRSPWINRSPITTRYNKLQDEEDALGGRQSPSMTNRRSSVVEAGMNPFTL